MGEYLVTWTINVDSDSPRHAAEDARYIMGDPGMATVFEVTAPNGTTTQIDLSDDDEEEA